MAIPAEMLRSKPKTKTFPYSLESLGHYPIQGSAPEMIQHILKHLGEGRFSSWIGVNRMDKFPKINFWRDAAQAAGDRITVSPRMIGGLPCIRGTRVAVRQVLYMLAEGTTWDNVLSSYPQLNRDDISAALKFAATVVDWPDEDRE